MKERPEPSRAEAEAASATCLRPAVGKRTLSGDADRASPGPSPAAADLPPAAEVEGVDALADAGSETVDAAALEPAGAQCAAQASAATTPSPAETTRAGKGLEAVKALVEAGAPEPRRVVRIIDAHRVERDAILAYLGATLGGEFVKRVSDEAAALRIDLKRREMVAGDPADPKGGYFLASQDEKGARWRTADGSFDGKLGKGLDARYHLDDSRAIHFGVNKGEAVAGYEKDGKTLVEGFGKYRKPDDHGFGIRAPIDFGDSRTLTGELRHMQRPDGASNEVAGNYRDPTTTANAYLGQHESGRAIGGISASHALDPATSVSGSATVGPESLGVSLAASRQLSQALSVSGSLAHSSRLDGSQDRNVATVAGAWKPVDALALTGSLSHAARNDGSQGLTTLQVSERFRSQDMLHGLDLNATKGTSNSLRGVGSIERQLAPDLYAGAFASFTAERGKESEATLGASLTFTPHEKTALTLAGVIDREGRVEARLQMDVFKKRVDSVQALSDAKKGALVSLFVSYSTDTPGMLNERFGGPQKSVEREQGGGTLTGGVRIRF